MSEPPWAPVHYEDIHEEKPAEAKKPRAKGKPSDPPNKDKPTGVDGVPFAMTLMLAIPPDAIAAIMSLAGTQERIASAIEANTKTMADFIDAIKNPPQPKDQT